MAKKKSEVKYASGLADSLDTMAAVYSLGVLGSVGADDAGKTLHLLSSACHHHIGLEGQRSESIGGMLLLLIVWGAQSGVTTEQIIQDAAKRATELADAAALAASISRSLSKDTAALAPA